jgi:hypothetical protein
VVREIVNIYKEVAKPDAKGLTKTDFRNLFFKNNPTERRKKDRRLQDEVCGDMFRMLDKDGDGYVMLQDLLKHFVPPQQVCVVVECGTNVAQSAGFWHERGWCKRSRVVVSGIAYAAVLRHADRVLAHHTRS